jgi:putative acetyltransferase
MIEFRMSTSQDMPRVLDIWRRAVDATHDFLAPADRAAIDAEVPTFLPQVSLLLAVDASGVPQGFMFLHEGHLEALFIDPNHHGQGLGKALIERALVEHPNLTTDVNEQNPRALGFYERVGFERTGRSALDGQGRAYPLIHLRYRS